MTDRVGRTLTCNRCNTSIITSYNKRGVILCKKCGAVMEDHMVYRPPKRDLTELVLDRIFSADSRKH